MLNCSTGHVIRDDLICLLDSSVSTELFHLAQGLVCYQFHSKMLIKKKQYWEQDLLMKSKFLMTIPFNVQNPWRKCKSVLKWIETENKFARIY